jgi:hypothetical protein
LTKGGAADEGKPSDEDVQQSANRASSKDADSSGERTGQGIGALLGKPLLAALPEILEQQGEQWLRSQLDQGIDLLFSHWTRAAIQQEVEQALQRAARIGIALVSDRATREELSVQSEQTVERMVQIALDRLFADEVRDDLKARGHDAIGALFHPDLKSILQQAQEMLLSLIEGFIAVLRECWEQLVQLLTSVVLALVQPRLTGILKDTLASLATTPGRDRDKKDRASSADTEREGDETHRARTGHVDDASDGDDRERGRPRPRARDDEEIADDSGHGTDRRPTRAPSGRSSVGRPPAARQTSGRSLSDRSASRRPSRAPSR